MPLVKKLTRHGNSYALILDKALLDLLDIGQDTPLSIRVVQGGLLVTPAPEEDHRQRVKAASERANKRYSKVFKKLAE